jgi:hypothetical protein
MVTSSPRRPKILCLGVSYADVNATRGYNSSVRDVEPVATTNVLTTSSAEHHSTSSLNAMTADDVICLVEERILNQMDGRDLTRILATEELCQVDVYCVSQEKGAIYRQDRHLDANFNRPTFVKKLQQAFSEDIQFDQIILDYFWIPTGWDVHHWSMSFFASVLNSFAKSKLISPSSPSTSAHTGLYRNGIYLPFCFHCFQSIVTYSATLTSHYNISFIRKSDLQCITLWAGTQTINKQRMQHVLGKRIDQEEVYCTFTIRHLKEMECSAAGASKKELLDVARCLEDFPDIRFIILEPLHILDQKDPHYVAGRILGLTAPHCVRRGFHSDERLIPLSKKSMVLQSSVSSPSCEVATRKRKVSNATSFSVNSPRKSPRFDSRHQSPDSVLPVSLQSSLTTKNKQALRPKVLFSSFDEEVNSRN